MLQNSLTPEYFKKVNYVLKRDGTTEGFDASKIETAVSKAMNLLELGVRIFLTKLLMRWKRF